MPLNNRFFKDITVKMTDAEIAEVARSHAAASYQLELLEEDKKAAAKEWATRVEAAEIDVKKLRDKVRSGTKVIPVECRRAYNETTFAVETFRLDTSELVESRPMTTEERNRVLNPTLPGVQAEPPARDEDAVPDLGDDGVCTVCDGVGTVDGGDGGEDPDCDACGGSGELADQKARAKEKARSTAEAAFSAPAPVADAKIDERDAFLANKAATRPPPVQTQLPVSSASEFGDPWDQPAEDAPPPKPKRGRP